MTPEQRAQETTAAQSLSERLCASIQNGVFSAIQDIRRRLIEEPWYGRTVNDILAERQRGSEAFYASGRELYEAMSGTTKGRAVEPGRDKEMQEIDAMLFGKPEEQQQQNQGQGHGRGMEI